MCHGDPTSLDVDLTRMQKGHTRTSCPHYESSCSFDVAKVGKISFDVEMRNCAKVWACPLWMSPETWRSPQRESGEIDFVENCDDHLNVSFGESLPYYSEWPGRSAAKLGKQHVVLEFQKDGSVLPTMTDSLTGEMVAGVHLTGSQSYQAMTSKNWGSNPFKLVSDIWNGTEGNPGYAACQKQTKPDSECGYTVQNIKIFPKPGEPKLFSGKCEALNP